MYRASQKIFAYGVNCDMLRDMTYDSDLQVKGLHNVDDGFRYIQIYDKSSKYPRDGVFLSAVNTVFYPALFWFALES